MKYIVILIIFNYCKYNNERKQIVIKKKRKESAKVTTNIQNERSFNIMEKENISLNATWIEKIFYSMNCHLSLSKSKICHFIKWVNHFISRSNDIIYKHLLK